MSNAIDYRAIQNVISTYCIALDDKNFSLLNQVFTPDVEAQYPFSTSPIQGVEALGKRISQRLGPVTTQHALTTQTITIEKAGDAARATTYFTGVHLGKGKWEGQLVTAYGKYIDELVCDEDEEKARVFGAKGNWLICKREVLFFGRVGEEGVMEGEGHD